MKKWKVEGRIRADIQFKEIVEASNEQAAIRKAEKIVYDRIGITAQDIVLDDEFYAEKLS